MATTYPSQPGSRPRPAPPVIAHDTRPTSFLAVASLVFGILWIFGVGSLVAVIAGHWSRQDTDRGRQKGEGAGHAGLILGYLGLLPIAVFLLILAVGGGNPLADVRPTSYAPVSVGQEPPPGCHYAGSTGIVCP